MCLKAPAAQIVISRNSHEYVRNVSMKRSNVVIKSPSSNPEDGKENSHHALRPLVGSSRRHK